MNDLYQMAQQSLLRALHNNNAKTPDRKGYDYYFTEHRDNLVPGITPDIWNQVATDLGGGDGGELKPTRRGDKLLPPKFDAIHSSSALPVNTFARWRLNPGSFTLLNTTGFTEMQFEKKLDTGLRGVPNLDLFLLSPTHIISVESKFLEFIQSAEPKPQHFSASYDPQMFPFISDRVWWDAIEKYNDKGMRCPVAQLIKHSFGLMCLLEQRRELASRKVILLYLYWKPVNASKYPVYQTHDAELEDFSKMVNSGKGSIEFVSKTYSELWDDWEKLPGYAEHVKQLRKRYLIAIEERDTGQ